MSITDIKSAAINGNVVKEIWLNGVRIYSVQSPS
jgi:hypothetical protein